MTSSLPFSLIFVLHYLLETHPQSLVSFDTTIILILPKLSSFLQQTGSIHLDSKIILGMSAYILKKTFSLYPQSG